MIESLHSPHIARVKALISSRGNKERGQHGEFIAEGLQCAREALAATSGPKIKNIYFFDINNKTNLKTITNNNAPETNTETSSSSSSSTERQLDTNTQKLEHPPLFDEYDDFVHKCQKDAIRNSEKIAEIQTTIPQITQATISSFTEKYKIPLIIVSVFIIVLIIGIILYHIYKQE